MLHNLILMIPKFRISLRANITVITSRQARMIGRKDRGHGAYNRANSLIHSLLLRLTDNLLKSRAGLGVHLRIGGGEARVLVEVMMVSSRGVGYGADLPVFVEVDVWVRGREHCV